MCGDFVSILNRLCLCAFFKSFSFVSLDSFINGSMCVLFVDLLCLSRLWLKWLSIGKFCTEFQIRDNIRDEWEVPRARSQYLANLRKIYTRRNKGTKWNQQNNNNKKLRGQMQTTKQNDNSMVCLKSTVIFNVKNNHFVFDRKANDWIAVCWGLCCVFLSFLLSYL